MKIRQPLRYSHRKITEPKILEIMTTTMMKARVSEIDGTLSGEMELPVVFNTPIREDIIHKSYVNLLSHNFQKQGRYPNAGEVVSAESRNTGQGIARIARARGEGFRGPDRLGGAGVRHGRVAHPPESWKNTYKKINKKENKYGLCSSIALPVIKNLLKDAVTSQGQ